MRRCTHCSQGKQRRHKLVPPVTWCDYCIRAANKRVRELATAMARGQIGVKDLAPYADYNRADWRAYVQRVRAAA